MREKKSEAKTYRATDITCQKTIFFPSSFPFAKVGIRLITLAFSNKKCKNSRQFIITLQPDEVCALQENTAKLASINTAILR